MMFALLPLMSAVVAPLYGRPRRCFVEHLVFFLHEHAALLLAMTLEILLAAGARRAPARAPLVAIGGVATARYAFWYVDRSMRRFDGQRRLLTLPKLALVSLAYLFFLCVTPVGTLVVNALAG